MDDAMDDADGEFAASAPFFVFVFVFPFPFSSPRASDFLRSCSESQNPIAAA